MRQRHRLLLAGLLALATACGGGEDTSDPLLTGSPPTEPGPRPTDPVAVPPLPDDGDAAFVQIGPRGVPAITAGGQVFRSVESRHGFARPDARLAAVPAIPPVGALEVAQLTRDGLGAVVRKAAHLGLLQEPPDYGDPMITDQGSLTVTFATAGSTYEHDVYAPGQDVDDPEAQAARHRLDEFVQFVESLHLHLNGELGPWSPYVPERWEVDVHASHVRADDAEPWPFEVVPVDGCGTFDATATDTVSGVYTAEVPGKGTSIVEVRPALPFTDC